MKKAPNVLFIVMDSVRAANLSCYGYHLPTTPHIDALAKQGTQFDRAITQGCWTLPVHASLFTGLYPSGHGVTISQHALPADTETLPERLKQRGYQTICLSNNPYVSALNGLVGGFETIQDLWRATRSRGHRRTKASMFGKKLEQFRPWSTPAIGAIRKLQSLSSMAKRCRVKTDSGAALTNATVDRWLKTERVDADPFFMFINFMECHEPYNPPHPFNRRFMSKRFTPWRVAKVAKHTAVDQAIAKAHSAGDVEILRALYDGELAYLDEQIGRLMQILDANGVLEDTVVILTADHGDSLGEHGRFGHRVELYEPLVHVPLIVRFPSRFAAGARVPQQVELIDVYPTILELAGFDASTICGTAGCSLLDPPSALLRPFTFAENTAPRAFGGVVSRMVRSSRYKFLWQSDGRHQLFDLLADPGELQNLINIKPEVAREMQAALDEWQQSLNSNVALAAGASQDETVLSLLRDLGYVS